LSRMTLIDDVVETGVQGFNFPKAEELSPPIIRLDEVSVGYDGRPILQGLDMRIDQDDRIALLGANGQGKSTFAKLLSDRLAPMTGKKYASNKLRIGYFAQHQVDELDVAESAIDHLRRHRKSETPSKLRARLGAGGLPPDTHELPVGKLSGGQKARLSLLLATLDAPHLIVLDEPTNHLDIESREALVRALTDYSGAVILVSHDPHLVELVADQLWLVHDGTVSPFDGDMDAYRKFLLSARGVATREKARRTAQVSKADLADLKAELARAEERVQKLEIMRDQIDQKMADPGLYERGAAEIGRWQMKHAEVVEALARAENLWASAQDKLDKVAS
jgi:ATP-binding cassette, subfamily F, member 3